MEIIEKYANEIKLFRITRSLPPPLPITALWTIDAGETGDLRKETEEGVTEGCI